MTRRKTSKDRSVKDRSIEFLAEQAHQNTLAIKEGPKKKAWSLYDLKTIKPITTPQRSMFESFFMGNHIVASGSAGTGKTMVALYLALSEVLNKESKYKKIILVRSTVQTRNMGFVKGSTEEKEAPFEMAYSDIVNDLLKSRIAYESLKENGTIKFVSTAFVRGLTWDDSIIIVDESQSNQLHELSSIITRTGNNSRIIILGDTQQDDLNFSKMDQSGFPQFLKILEKMDEIDIIRFTRHDIVRSALVKSYLCAFEDVMCITQ